MTDHDPTNGDQPRASCAATTAAGAPCRGRPRDGSSWCFAHDPDLADARAEARVRGGRNRSTVARGRRRIPRELREILELLETALVETHDGDLDPSQARACASLATAIVRVRESLDLEVRLVDLEAELDTIARREAAARRPVWTGAA